MDTPFDTHSTQTNKWFLLLVIFRFISTTTSSAGKTMRVMHTMGWNCMKSTREAPGDTVVYSLICSHPFAYSAILTFIARFVLLIRSLACWLPRSRGRGKRDSYALIKCVDFISFLPYFGRIERSGYWVRVYKVYALTGRTRPKNMPPSKNSFSSSAISLFEKSSKPIFQFHYQTSTSNLKKTSADE